MNDAKEAMNENNGREGEDATSWMKRIFMAPEGVVKSRLVICSKCEHFNRTTRMCAVCHCIMPLKTRLAGTRCPEGKWHAFVRPPKPDNS